MTGFYPKKLCRTFLQAAYGDYNHAPSLSVLIQDALMGHRQEELNSYIFGVPNWSACDEVLPLEDTALSAPAWIAEKRPAEHETISLQGEWAS